MSSASFENKVCIYKPSRSGSGGAVQFDLNIGKRAVFVEAAAQKDEQTFDWERKIVLKLSVFELAKLCTVFDGKLPKAELFHVPSKSKFVTDSNVQNTTLSVQRGQYGFFFKVSEQDQSRAVRAVQVPLSEDEALLLSTVFKAAMVKIYGW